MAMCFQTYDSNLAYYNDYFFKTYSIVVKPLELQRKVYLVEMPTPVALDKDTCVPQQGKCVGGVCPTFDATAPNGGGFN
jgi:hypothetical protein